MSSRHAALLTAACALLLRLTSLLLPRRERAEWLAEWRGELHYLLHRRVPVLTCLAFSMGAIPDAFWIRRHLQWPRLETARSCLLLLAAGAALTAGTALLVPSVRQEMFPPAYRGPSDLVTISSTPTVLGTGSQISAGEYLAWSTHAHPSLSRTAFYEPVSGTVDLNGRGETWLVGRATESLTALLHIRASESLLQECRRTGAAPLVLSRAAWMRDFAGTPGIVGRSLRFEGQRATIIAIAPPIDSALPMPMDAWTLETEEAIAPMAADRFSHGYMLAQRVAGSGNAADIGVVQLISDDGTPVRLCAIPLAIFAHYHRMIPEIDFLLGLFMACLVMPAVLFISLQAGLVTERLSLKMRTRGWFFLVGKIALLLPLLYCGPLLIAHALASAPGSEQTIQTFTTIAATLASAWWLLEDQRQRCPHCLRRLTSPARVGERSRSFLGFSGMEFVCAQGHGLLHVPDYPTSWFSSQRWLSLDSSWRVLFQPGH
ncbi:MAG TPA: hypothetical protein VJS11_04870 [Acidobacteriaceae bacterium]|nr:hypothetical protein [Acidobacteriaceae bacterium]